MAKQILHSGSQNRHSSSARYIFWRRSAFSRIKKQRHVDDKDDETLIDVKSDLARETPEEIQETSSKDNSRLEAMKKELSGLSQRLFLLKERRGRLECYPASGPWADDFYKYRYDTYWDRTRPSCEERGGCCSRGCGCCRKPRQPSTGQKSSANGATSHCTVACGCCIRERGFYIPSSERLEEATDEWIGEWDLDWLINEVV